nr:uncharacterized protein LOC127489351 [Oryctolagus cuniculus]
MKEEREVSSGNTEDCLLPLHTHQESYRMVYSTKHDLEKNTPSYAKMQFMDKNEGQPWGDGARSGRRRGLRSGSSRTRARPAPPARRPGLLRAGGEAGEGAGEARGVGARERGARGEAAAERAGRRARSGRQETAAREAAPAAAPACISSGRLRAQSRLAARCSRCPPCCACVQRLGAVRLRPGGVRTAVIFWMINNGSPPSLSMTRKSDSGTNSET